MMEMMMNESDGKFFEKTPTSLTRGFWHLLHLKQD
jgi:hypothetical protein